MPHPILFSATKDGKTAYFFGTVHLGVDIEKRLPPWVWQHFITAQTFAMETNLQDPSLIAAVMRTDGTTLHAELGDDYWKKFVAAVGEPMANGVNSMKLSTASSLIEIQGLPMTAPMDLVFADPPYEVGNTEVESVLSALGSRGWLASGAVAVVERSASSPALAWPPGWDVWPSRRYGDTRIEVGSRS